MHATHSKITVKCLSILTLSVFLLSTLCCPVEIYAQDEAPEASKVMDPQTEPFAPLLIQGINIDYDDALKINFLINKGDTQLPKKALEAEAEKLIKYFLASLTVPEEQMWVNLSIYEEDRIIPETFGKTQMGSDLLAQDYLLKKVMSSMMYPENKLGKDFWNKVHARAEEEFGITDIPLNTFNKVWIIASDAKIYEHNNGAFVVDSHMKVMLEEDYLAMSMAQQEDQNNPDRPLMGEIQSRSPEISKVTSELLRTVLIPELEKEVNKGELFANLRQIYNAMILASWYKQALKESLLGQIYIDQGKTDGVEMDDKKTNQEIYEEYVQSVKKGVYTFIKEEYDAASKEIIARKYFSGGVRLKAPQVSAMTREAIASLDPEDFAMISAELRSTGIIENPDLAAASTGAVQKRLQDAYAYLDTLQNGLEQFQGLYYNGLLVAQRSQVIDTAMTTTVGELKQPGAGFLGSAIFASFMRQHFPETEDDLLINIRPDQEGNIFVTGPDIESGVVRLPSAVKKELQATGDESVLQTFYYWPQQNNQAEEDDDDDKALLFYNGIQIGTPFVEQTTVEGTTVRVPTAVTYQDILTRFLKIHGIPPEDITAQQEEGTDNWFVYGPPVTPEKRILPETAQPQEEVGGIDLYSENLNMKIEKDADGGIIPIAPQVIENINIKGFRPVIIEVAPVSNLPVLIGFHEQNASSS
jgi:hypothetical protein